MSTSDKSGVKKKTPELNVEYEAGLGETAANSLDKDALAWYAYDRKSGCPWQFPTFHLALPPRVNWRMKPKVFGYDDLQLHTHGANCQGQTFFRPPQSRQEGLATKSAPARVRAQAS